MMPSATWQDRFEVLDGLGFFELGDDPGLAAVGATRLRTMVDVFGGADEGDGYRVDAGAQGEFQIDVVFFRRARERGRRCRAD